MNKEYLNHVKYVKESLNIWFSNVEQLHNGIQMFSKENDLDRKNTDFGKWYYNEGQVFSSFETFRILEAFYDNMYDNYLDYIALRKKPVKKSLFSNNSEKRQKELEVLFFELKKSTRKLIKSVDIFEENLRTSPLFDEAPAKEESVAEIIDTAAKEKEDEVFTIDEESHPIIQSETEASEKLEAVSEVPEMVSSTVDNFDDEKLVQSEETSAQFDNNLVQKDDTVQDENLEKTPDVKDKKLNPTDQEDKLQFDFEKRLQEEVAKIKEQLRKELIETQKSKLSDESSKIAESSNKDEINTESSEKNTDFKPKTKSTKKTPDIDLDEEIRRILS